MVKEVEPEKVHLKTQDMSKSMGCDVTIAEVFVMFNRFFKVDPNGWHNNHKSYMFQ